MRQCELLQILYKKNLLHIFVDAAHGFSKRVHQAGDTDCSYISNGAHDRHYGAHVRATIEMQKA
jgi:hypothetical protein